MLEIIIILMIANGIENGSIICKGEKNDQTSID